MYEEVNTSLVDDEDDEMTDEFPPYSSSTSMVNEDGLPDNNRQRLVSYFHLSPSSFIIFFS